MKDIQFRAMGCQMSAFLDSSSSKTEELLLSVPEWFEEWEQIFSRFRSDSELSRINQQSGEITKVSDTFWNVLELAISIENNSHGLVTPLILPALELIGYSVSFEQISEQSALPSQLPDSATGILDNVILYPDSREIHLPFGFRLDFGGIAKGWAAHRAMERLSRYGPALVSAGGDIAVSGLRNQGVAWMIGVTNPFQPDMDLGSIEVGRSGVATSGRDFRQWKQDGILRHHIIDPRTGLPAETDLLSVTVIGPDVIEAEMAAKIVMILGSKTGTEWLNTEQNLSAILVMADGQVLETENIGKYNW
jgi:thiamine biosynthesis lipoprotein